MGLTSKSTGINTLANTPLYKDNQSDIVIDLVGNPNVGKSTIFNALTGMNQHTGNWTGKTVTSAYGKFNYNDGNFILVDLPGTYSLTPNSKEEEVTRDFIAFYNPKVTIIVIDATNIERNLTLVLQTMEINSNVILCINLIDEAKKNNIYIDINELEKELKIPIITTNARDNIGLDKLLDEIYKRSSKNVYEIKKINYPTDIEQSISVIENYLNKRIEFKNNRWLSIKLLTDSSINNSIKEYLNYDMCNDNILLNLIKSEQDKYEDINNMITKRIFLEAERIFIKTVSQSKENKIRQNNINKILTSKLTGIPIMILTFVLIFWITIKGANYPSEILSNILFSFEIHIYNFFNLLNFPLLNHLFMEYIELFLG